METSLQNELRQKFNYRESGIFTSGYEGYWSNLNKDENRALIELLQIKTARQAIKEDHEWLEAVIFSPKRQAGLELLQLDGSKICIDYGCMWGGLTIPLAKRTRFVLGVDYTLDSLRFLMARAREENLSNIETLCCNLRKMPELSTKVDVAIVSGVLEWIPEEGPIELKSYFGQRQVKVYSDNPGVQQKDFLKKVFRNLKVGGKLYLAVENRYDFKQFLGVKDPHTNLLFTSFSPRNIANRISMIMLGRPYVNWLYSFKEISSILKESGFLKVDLYMCFPDYRFPERIIPYEHSLKNFEVTIAPKNSKGKRMIKKSLARAAEFFVFKILKAKYLSPSIIAIAYK